MKTRIKICGITTMQSAQAAVDAGADAIGFVFAPRSPRRIRSEDAAEIMADLPLFVATVSLFVNPSVDTFIEIEQTCPTTHVQLHGQEDEALVEQCGPAIKAVHFKPDTAEQELARWQACDAVEAVLVDGSSGGQGTTLDWAKLATLTKTITKPLILAGGLSPDNVHEAIRIVRPYAVDVSSSVESAPGVKDDAKIKAFCHAVQQADAEMASHDPRE